MKRIKYICFILLLTIISYNILQIFGNKYVDSVEQYVSTDIGGINTSAYPGIKERIQSLKAKYPNWNFKLLYTNLDWNTVIIHVIQVGFALFVEIVRMIMVHGDVHHKQQ